jgi:hypothetical protein
MMAPSEARRELSSHTNFYEKALFVKPTWRLPLRAERNGFECPSRYASIRTFCEPTPRWLGAQDEIRLFGLYQGAAIFLAVFFGRWTKFA